VDGEDKNMPKDGLRNRRWSEKAKKENSPSSYLKYFKLNFLYKIRLNFCCIFYIG